MEGYCGRLERKVLGRSSNVSPFNLQIHIDGIWERSFWESSEFDGAKMVAFPSGVDGFA